MANKLIYASDARRAILKEDPKLAYCIDEIPGVDAVEVVRCCVCKSHDHDGGCGYCNRWDKWTKMSDFCSHGERTAKDGK